MTTRIVILGGGFAGVSTARQLERSAPADAHLTLVNRENFQLFTPMLPEVASASLEMRAIVQPLRVTLKRTTIVVGEVSAIDMRTRHVTIDLNVFGTPITLPFDHLVFALGSEVSTHGIPGIAEHTYALKTLPDAVRLQARVGSAFEAASLERDRTQRDRFLRFVIAGGGFNGVEIAGELANYLKRLQRYYPPLQGVTPEIVVIENRPRLLEELPPKFGTYAAASLRNRNIRIELGEEIAAVDANGLFLKNGKRFDTSTIIWTAGEKPSTLLQKTGLQTSQHGALIVENTFAVPGLEGIWGLGDCARIPKMGGGEVAPLAQNAVREGPLLAHNIIAAVKGRPLKPFTYRPLGMMASLGDHDAIAQLPGDHLISGLPAWLMWRAYYLSQLPGITRKMRATSDWTINALSPQNITYFPWISPAMTAKDEHAPSR